MDITTIDIVPNASGCGHAELRATVDGVQHRITIRREDFRLETPDDVLTAVLNRIRSHIKESGLTNLALIRADLQTRSFKI
jgi:hypothetical protein